MNYHLYELKSFQETDKACLLLRLGCLFIIMSASFVFIISGVEVSKCPFSKQSFSIWGYLFLPLWSLTLSLIFLAKSRSDHDSAQKE